MPIPIRHVLPMSSENRWSDLLAVLVEADPAGASSAFGLRPPLRTVSVRREALASDKDRVDLLISDSDRLRAVVDVKLLSGLGPSQLRRYEEAFPGAERYVMVCPQRLPLHVAAARSWDTATWEDLLTAFTGSANRWVAETAAAWRDHLATTVPRVDAQTRWNDLRDGEDFVVAMRARMSWVYEALNPPAEIDHDLVESSAGVSWVARMSLPAMAPGYVIRVEAEENLPVRDFPKYASTAEPAVRGPSVKVCLVQTGVDTSRDFDWGYLLSLWRLMSAARTDWVTAPARPKAPHDRTGWLQMIARGGSRYLGIGFGDAQARRAHECMFGARFQLPPDSQLAHVGSELQQTVQLMLTMAAADPPDTVAR